MTSPAIATTVRKDFDFYARVGCDRHRQTFVAQQYAAYPFRLSRTFRLDSGNDRRAYLYLMNSAPGLFGGDRLTLGLKLDPDTRLHLTDQAATKVHKMSATGAAATAQLSWDIAVGAGSYLEFVPEPLILYAEAELQQTVNITLEPDSTLFCSEILVPGRLARAEYYQFREYRNHLRVLSPDRTLLFGDAMRLQGQSNTLKDSFLFAKYPLMANIYAVLPGIDLERLKASLAENPNLSSAQLLTGISLLPNCNGIIIKIMGDRCDRIQGYIWEVLSCIRKIRGDANLPHIPK